MKKINGTCVNSTEMALFLISFKRKIVTWTNNLARNLSKYKKIGDPREYVFFLKFLTSTNRFNF